MDNVQFLAWLQENDACDPAVKKLGGQSAQQVWDTWDNPSELLWWVEESGLVNKRELTLLICGIVRNTPLTDGRTVWDLLADERSRNAVEVAERWAHGKATDKEMAAAGEAARLWQLAYIRKQLPDFVERFTEALKNTYGVL